MLQRYRTWVETEGNYPEEWRRASGDSEFVLYLTADELKALRGELLDLLLPRCHERLTDPSLRPPGSVPVEMLVFTYPLALPERVAEAPGSGTPANEIDGASLVPVAHTEEEP